MGIGGGRDHLISPWPIGRMRLAPDGTLFHTHYWRGFYPENGAPDLFFQQYYFKSEDDAHSWSLVSSIPFVPDIRRMPMAYFADGFCEADVAFMPDGSMFTLLRTGYSLDMQFPMYYARSTDGGKSFSEPQVFDRLGVMGKKIFVAIITVANCAFCAILCKTGIDKVMTQMANGKKTPSLLLPEWIFTIFLPIGAVFLILHTIEFCVDVWTNNAACVQIEE
jgi:hypothetical protein